MLIVTVVIELIVVEFATKSPYPTERGAVSS
jgi:hypothetical protein